MSEALSAPGVPPVVEVSVSGTSTILPSHRVVPIASLDTFDPLADPLAATVAPKTAGDAERVRARRIAYRERAPERHLERWLELAEVDFEPNRPHVSCLLVTMRPGELADAVARYDGQSYPNRSLVVVCHRFGTDDLRAAADLLATRDDVTLMRRDAATTLGECVNVAARAARGDILAKWDDDDLYGPGYVEDAVNALRYSKRDVIVKAAQYTFIEAKNVTILRRPGAEETDFDGDASGGSYVFRRRVWEDAPFPHRNRAIDVKFLAGARCVGHSVYSNSRFDFAYVRRAEGSTWTVSDDLMLAQGDVVFEGPPHGRVDA